MERILLVEDNQSLSKLISMKITSELSFEVDIAYTYKEAQLFMRKYTYFLALLDLNLPDAPDGEIVDSVIEQDIPCIVLSGNLNKAFRQEMLEKDIIDYVGKNGIEDIDYTISIIDRLNKNRHHKVLIVDDSMVFRQVMQGMMKNLFFQVFTVGHGEEALAILEENPDTRIVLTDYHMPVMDGLELTKEIRKKFKKSELSILAISGNEESEVSAMFLKNGATDFIKKPFSKEEFSCRVNNAIESLENIDTILNHANRDFLTGLYNRRYFFKTLDPYFEGDLKEEESLIIAMVDIDHFKKINDTYGHEIGDSAIIHLSELLRANTKEGDIVARFGGEEFCIVLKNITADEGQNALERIRHKVETSSLYFQKDTEITFTISIGATSHMEDTLDNTVNQADMLLYNAKHAGRNKLIFE